VTNTQTATVSLNVVDLRYATEVCCVFLKARTEFMNVVEISVAH